MNLMVQQWSDRQISIILDVLETPCQQLNATAFMLMLLALLATGLDIVTAFSAVGACINNLGPGLGSVTQTYGSLSDTAKWILCFAMLLGRLEVFTLLVLFTPMFWRR